MKKRKLTRALFMTILLLSSICMIAQIRTTVYEIDRDPSRYIDEYVQVSGLVIQYVPGKSATIGHYLLKDDNGPIIRVNTNMGQPETNKKYEVTGNLYQERGELFISENSRNRISGTIETPLLLAILVGVLLVVGIVVYLAMHKKTPSPQPVTPARPTINPTISSPPPQPAPQTPPSPPSPPSPHSPQSPKTDYDSDKTVIVDKEYFTMKAIPGSLMILTGPQANERMQLFGTPTPEGSIITIGRDAVNWKNYVKKGMENSHIRLKDETRTLHRLQAELRYKNGVMSLKNLGTTNFTKVDGRELGVGELIDIKDGTVIEAGHTKFQYTS